jgi:hypothetical protein
MDLFEGFLYPTDKARYVAMNRQNGMINFHEKKITSSSVRVRVDFITTKYYFHEGSCNQYQTEKGKVDDIALNTLAETTQWYQ